MGSQSKLPPVMTPVLWLLVVANVVAVAASFAYAAMTQDLLPPYYPVHFGASGVPDRFAEAGSAEWYLIPGVIAVMAASLVGLAVHLPRIPLSKWNMPRKEQLLAAPPQRQVEVVRATVLLLLVLSLLDSVLLQLIHVAMFRVALGHPPELFLRLLLPGTIVYAVVVAAGIVWLIRVTARAVGAGRAGVEKHENEK